MDDIFRICDVIRITGLAIHNFLRHGHFEKVYENALVHRLRKQGLEIVQQHPLRVLDEDGTPLGDYAADLLVDAHLIVEVKACKALVIEHIAQVLGYLRATRLIHGVLVNFGAPRFQIKKLILSETQPRDHQADAPQ
jgi:GxxExxY protein